MNILCCADCADSNIDFSEIWKTAQKGWEKEMKHQKWEQKDINKYNNKMKKVKVNKRLEKIDDRKVK